MWLGALLAIQTEGSFLGKSSWGRGVNNLPKLPLKEDRPFTRKLRSPEPYLCTLPCSSAHTPNLYILPAYLQ